MGSVLAQDGKFSDALLGRVAIMSTIFRPALNSDIGPAVALLRNEACFVASEAVWSRMPSAWARGLATESLVFLVYEDLQAPVGERLVSVGMSVMVSDAFVHLLRAGAGPYAAQLLYTESGFDERFVLSRREIAKANAHRALNLFVLHNPLRYRDPKDPKVARIMPVGLAGFQYAHDGYNLRRLIWEVYGEFYANALASAGYRTLDPFTHSAQANAVSPASRPYLMARLADDEQPPGYAADQMMLSSFLVPTLRLTASQQRLARLALLEYDDIELERALGVSRNAIKQTWRGIYDKAKTVLPNAFESHGEERRASPRRAVLNYLRQHMEEVRPFQK
jgi:DNA-binding CsgD family transcriptional regulator